MATVTITLTDVENPLPLPDEEFGAVKVHVETDPEFPEQKEDASAAQLMAQIAVQTLASMGMVQDV